MLTLSCVNIGGHFLHSGVVAGVFGGAAAAAGQAEDAQVRLGEVQTAAPADGQQVSVLRSCHQLFLTVAAANNHEVFF